MTRGRIRAVSGHARFAIEGWQLRAAAPGSITEPSALPADGWLPAQVPGTAASALRAAGAWSLDGPARRFDAEDWWWRASIALPDGPGRDVLCLGGLATLADVWIDGAHVLASTDMFLAHEVALPAGAREIAIRCRSIDPTLAAKRPRPRWRAPMIEHQQLRAIRTTLLGRTPGWSPPAAAVGPWRGVWIERRAGVEVHDLRLHATVIGDDGRLAVDAAIDGVDRDAGTAALILRRGDDTWRAPLALADGRLFGALGIPEVQRWWPHTHGEPACYEASIVVDDATIDLGPVGFRTIAVDRTDDDFAIIVNGARIFARGACWTPIDPVTLAHTPEALARAFDQVSTAGMNMLRVGGTMVYEDDAFLDACDRRGILLWHELMFANMDYPEDPAFLALVEAEVAQALARVAARPCLAVVCGNSEGEQQAAMWGAPTNFWAPPLFHAHIPRWVATHAPGVPYWPSSAHGGAFPHQPNAGTSSYYGVGAYLRPLDDARRSDVRFASECLAFANVPGEAGLPGGPSAKVHSPLWKARTPRDLGAGWDFDDVRDHYVGRLFGVDPVALRYADHERYLALGRLATGEVMAQTFAEWRRARSRCRGGLVWFLRDLWPGAGWGLIEAGGAPKAAWFFLRRALQPVAVAISDEGTSGLAIHVVNDRGTPLAAELELGAWRHGASVARATRSITVPAHGAIELPAVALLDGFMDLSWAYRFGPPTAELVVTSLRVDGLVIAEAFHHPTGLPAQREHDLGVTAVATPVPDGAMLAISATRFAYAVQIAVEGHDPDDDFVHVAPGATRIVHLRRRPGAAAALRGTVQPHNTHVTTKLSVLAPSSETSS
ncbi:MAG: glycoside hydrolase family 2 protein [Deltaproteobacteria bacterium]|nr:glycoside hydrolase family 2 protein [Deltaproteobacteria bacterium]